MTYDQLLAYDDRPTKRGDYERFCCPLCGDDHRHDTEHQSLSLHYGRWICHRCGAKGVLSDYFHPASTRVPTVGRTSVKRQWKNRMDLN